MHRSEARKEGYNVFTVIVNEDRGFDKAALLLERQIQEVEKEFDVVYLSGPSFKEDGGGSSRNVYFGSQGAVLTRKRPPVKPQVAKPIAKG